MGSVTTDYSYDPNGNQIAAGLDTYAYDLAGKMISATDLAGLVTYTYGYDGDGKRLRTTTTEPLGTTRADDLWDINHNVPEIALQRDGTGAVSRRYIYGLGRLSAANGGTAFFYLHDASGSVAKVTSPGGAGQWSYTYEPFGGVKTSTHDDLTAPEQPMRFTGEYQDPTGLYHLRRPAVRPHGWPVHRHRPHGTRLERSLRLGLCVRE